MIVNIFFIPVYAIVPVMRYKKSPPYTRQECELRAGKSRYDPVNEVNTQVEKKGKSRAANYVNSELFQTSFLIANPEEHDGYKLFYAL
jgi:hypothetical protein